ncbi:MAG TPA: hypothetical protein EYH58_05905 [Aquifex aeolicus]|nr:hypothetical protein [Aquifex aeolicus]
MKVFLYDTNLIISSKIKNQLKALGVQLVNRENVDEDCIALVNLESPKGLEISKELKEKGIKVIGYCGHKNLSLMQEAKNLGVDLVVPNSQVAANLANILHEV